jgi:hypothetical protein
MRCLEALFAASPSDSLLVATIRPMGDATQKGAGDIVAMQKEILQRHSLRRSQA